MVKKITLVFVLIIGLILLINNAYQYPVNAGYDAVFHMRYAKIISSEWRIPEYAETAEHYNPPLFYLVSGLVGRLSGLITGQDFFIALKAWQYVGILLSLGSLYLWFQIFKHLNPNNKPGSYFFIALLFSLPVFHKTIVMFSIELFFLFITSLAFWYFIAVFQPKPSFKKLIILSILIILSLLTRLSAIVILLTMLIGLAGLGYTKKLNWRKVISYLAVLLILTAAGTGWFYYGRRHQGIYQVGETKKSGGSKTPFFQRQPISFYLDPAFVYLMTHPMRHEIPLNRLIPIYYSEFWGDYWNFYSQRRFNISVEARKKDHYLTSPERVANLALQNQINLPFTLLMISGFLYFILKTIKGFFKKSQGKWLAESIFLTFSCLTWLGFLYVLTKYPSWKSDTVKASYMLYNIPVFIYFVVIFLFEVLKKYKVIFFPVILYLILVSGVNLWWCWY